MEVEPLWIARSTRTKRSVDLVRTTPMIPYHAPDARPPSSTNSTLTSGRFLRRSVVSGSGVSRRLADVVPARYQPDGLIHRNHFAVADPAQLLDVATNTGCARVVRQAEYRRIQVDHYRGITYENCSSGVSRMKRWAVSPLRYRALPDRNGPFGFAQGKLQAVPYRRADAAK